MKSHKLTSENALPFILAGHALFTIKKITTDGRFTYKVNIPADTKPEEAKIWFVSILTGSDNTSNYSYIGFIKGGEFYWGKKSRIGINAPSVEVFRTIFNFISLNKYIPNKIEIWHEGKCCRCGRTLTVPESIESGVGPECARIISKNQNQLYAY